MKTFNQLDSLKEFGFSHNTIKVYDALLHLGEATASVLAKEAQVPTSKVYIILDQLVERELCYMEQGSKRVFKLIDPTVGFKKLQEEEKHRINMLEDISKQCGELFASNLNSEVEKSIKVVTSKHAIMNAFYELFETAQQGAVGFMRGPYLIDLNKKHSLNDPQVQSIQKGCKYRSIYEIGDESDERIREIANYFKAKGEEVRIHPKLPIKMALFDNSKLFIAFSHESSSGAIAIFLEHPDMASLFDMIFEMYWKEAEEI